MKLRNTIAFFLIIFSLHDIYSQDGGLIYLGTINCSIENAPNEIRPGFSIGAQGKIGSPGFFMSPGLVYQDFTIYSFDKHRYVNDQPSYKMLKLTNDAGFEYKIFKIFKFRFFVGASLNYVMTIDKNDYGVDFDTLSDAYFSYNYGAGISIGFVTLDFKRDNSITDFYKNYEKKGISFNCLNLGIQF